MTNRWLTFAGLALVTLACTCCAHAQANYKEGDCGGHGDVVDTGCNCTSPKPESTSIGFVGDTCSTPVYYLVASSEAETATCSGEPCASLLPKEEVCFFVALQSLLQSTAHFGLLLTSKDNAALDLKGLLTSDAANQPYPNSASHYNFAASTTAARPRASYSLNREALGAEKYSSLYLCISNSGVENATYDLRVAALGCPFQMRPDGSVSVCSSSGPEDIRQLGSTCPTGECTCAAQWTRPQSPTYAGLGFEDCSASSLTLPDEPSSAQHVDAQSPGTWTFFNFTVKEDIDRYTVATLTATADTESDVEMYFKFWQAPGRRVGEYDWRSEPGDFRRRSTRADLSSSLNLDKSCDCAMMVYRPGVWFLGVFVNGGEPVSYDLKLTKSSCPNDCSGARGTCDAALGTCSCAKETFVGEDCSSTTDKLSLDEPYAGEPRTGFSLDHYELPVGDTLSAAPGHSLSLVVEASFTPGAVALPAWVTERPVLLLSSAPGPTYENATLRQVLQDPDTQTTVEVDVGQVPTGVLYVSVFNPISSPYTIGYNVVVRTMAHCLGSCSDHGTCGTDGTCTCSVGFTGLDCSVDVEKLQKLSCQEGSLRRALPVAGGQAYSVCVCAAPEECQYTQVMDEAAIAAAVVVCDAGHELKGTVPDAIKLSDGSSVNGGGQCSHVHRGSSGGMVFFYCVLSVALFCGMVVGGKHGLEWYQLRRAGQVGGYADLGGSETSNLWDAFTGARRAQNNDSW